LIGGKYAEDFGLVLESENPYTGSEQGKCGTPSSAKRHYATKYEYIGGYYGGYVYFMLFSISLMYFFVHRR
jgi:cathepsin C